MTRKAAVSISTLIWMILGVLLIWFVGIPLLQNVYEGWQSNFICDGHCDAVCGEGYEGSIKGDAYCRKHSEGTKGGGPKCCIALNIGDQVIRPSDVKLVYTTKSKDPLSNGATVTLVPKYTKEGSYVVRGTFSLSFIGEAGDKRCYWRVGEEEWQEPVPKGRTPAKLFQELFNKYVEYAGGAYPEDDTIGLNNINFCRDLADKSTLSIPFTDSTAEGSETQVQYTSFFGKRMKYTLVIVDNEDASADCQGDVDMCDSFEHSVIIQVPDRNPDIRITLENSIGEKTAGTKEMTVLETGETNKLSLVISEPYATCTAYYNATIDLEEPFSLPFTPSMSKQNGVLIEQPRCFSKEFKHKFEVFIPESHAKAIPFDMTVNTSIGDRSLVTTYPFQIAPEQRVRVTGPSPGYAREKFVDISCHDVSCGGFKAAYIKTPMSCSEDGAGDISSGDWVTPEMRAYGGTSSAMWRFSIDDENKNGNYLCIKAQTDAEPIYSLGLHQQLPSKVTIDATPPHLTASYDPIQGRMNMGCEDQGTYQSGCAGRPFSYAYVVNPLNFAGSVLTVGLLNAEWSGCPDPDIGHYVLWNGADGQMPYLQQDVRVMCIKATDNAGNSVVKSRLVYGSAEVLGGFLMAYARNQ